MVNRLIFRILIGISPNKEPQSTDRVKADTSRSDIALGTEGWVLEVKLF